MITEKKVKMKRKVLSETDKGIAAVFKVLSDVNRYRIFIFLAEEPELTVSDIAKIMDISLPLASQHIKTLAHYKLLRKERMGKNIFPKIENKNPIVQAIMKIIREAHEKSGS